METVDAAMRRLIRQVREDRGMNQTELAREVSELGIPMRQTTISKIEDGNRKVGVDELLAIAAALEVPPTILMIPLDREEDFAVTPTVKKYPWYVYEWFVGTHPLRVERREAITPLDYYGAVRSAQKDLERVQGEERRARLVHEDEDELATALERTALRRRAALQRFVDAIGDMEDAELPTGPLWDRQGEWAKEIKTLGIKRRTKRERLHAGEEVWL